MNNRPLRQMTARRGMRGLSLIELMIALLLGLLVVGGATGIFLSNRRTYSATESVGRIQENARVAFELMARDMREAGGTPCAKNLPIANVINPTAGDWWRSWGDGIHGYDGSAASASFPFGTATAARVDKTDAVEVLSSAAFPGLTVVDNDPDATSNSANFKLNSVSGGLLEDGDIVMVCDYRQAALLQVTNVQGTNNVVVHNTGGSQKPGNCSKGLGVPTVCTTNGNRYEYGANSLLVKLNAVRWYIGHNGQGGRSLYRSVLRTNAGNAVPASEEVAEGVTGMEIEYLLPGAAGYVAAGSVNADDWKTVLAARISLDLEGPDRTGTDGKTLKRTLAHIATLRNRAP